MKLNNSRSNSHYKNNDKDINNLIEASKITFKLKKLV